MLLFTIIDMLKSACLRSPHTFSMRSKSAGYEDLSKTFNHIHKNDIQREKKRIAFEIMNILPPIKYKCSFIVLQSCVADRDTGNILGVET